MRYPFSDCWSVVVHLDHMNMGVKKKNALLSIVRFVLAKVNTGHNIRHCLHGFKKLLGCFWKFLCSFLRSKCVIITYEV